MTCCLKPPLFTCMFACCALSNADGDEGNGKTTHMLLTVFHLKKTFSESRLFLFSVLMPLSSLPGLKSLAFLLFLLLLPLLSSSPPLLCFPHDNSPRCRFHPFVCSLWWKSQASELCCPFKLLSLMPPHVGHVQLPSRCHTKTHSPKQSKARSFSLL